jgi:aldose 1-epimerase
VSAKFIFIAFSAVSPNPPTARRLPEFACIMTSLHVGNGVNSGSVVVKSWKAPLQFWHRVASCCGVALVLLSLVVQAGSVQAQESDGKKANVAIEKKEFGKTADGQVVHLYKLTNAQGHVLEMTDYGAIVVSVMVPDREGKLANVNLNFKSLEGYLQRHPYFGATVGRFCNRIAKGKFTLDGKSYDLAINNVPNHLHGGEVGFDKLVWKATEISEAGAKGLRFELTSPDGQEGYPGTLKVTADYVWTDTSELKIVLSATTDKPTVLNLTNHAYWNLAGAGSGDVLSHKLVVHADQYLGVDETLIPTGDMVNVEGTPLDFRTESTIGARISQLSATNGYDHCYVVRGKAGELRPAAKVVEPKSGRVMEIWTTQPGVQFYTGNFLNGNESNGGYALHGGFCLETQHYPDSPNQPKFPTTVLRPGEKFQQTTVHKFSVQK